MSSAQLAEADRLAKELEQKITAQKQPPSDLERLRMVKRSKNPCTPLSYSTKVIRFDRFELTLPGSGRLVLRRKTGIRSDRLLIVFRLPS